MIRRSTLLIFNFGTCIAFVVMGLLSTYVIQTLLPSIGKVVILPDLHPAARKSLTEGQDPEQIRAQAIFYFDLARDLKLVQATTELRELEAVRHVCYILAAVFALGAFMILAVKPTPGPAPAPAPAPGRT